MARGELYGLLAEFDRAERLVAAARRARAEGYRRMDAFSPFHVEELEEALEVKDRRLPWLVFAGGALGAVGGFSMQAYASVVSYPLNVGGRPLNSWPQFIPVTFELTILCAAFAAVLGMLALNGLPEPYHPIFDAPRFALASRDQFFLCIESRDPRFDLERTRAFLRSLEPRAVEEVRP